MKNLSHFIALKVLVNILAREKDFPKREKNKEVAIYYVPT